MDANTFTSNTISQTSWHGQRHIFALAAGFNAHRLLYVIALFSIVSAYAQSRILDVPPNLNVVRLFTGLMLMILAILIVFDLAFEMARLNRKKYQGALLPALWARLRDDTFAPQRVSNAVHSTLCLSVFLAGFSAMKSAIPQANPFSWDPFFRDLDAYLHFGIHPYEWLAVLLNSPIITSALNMNYHLWFFLMFGMCFWHGFARQDNRLRQHYLVAFMITWFIGTPILGTVFSSVGPVFHGRLYADQIDPFQPLLAWLHQANQTHPVLALGIMDDLWTSYLRGEGTISGISAMPSMHVATSVLFACCGFATGKRWFGWAMVVFAFAIFIGSIHLGWHYAVDGYFGAIIALVCWWGAKKAVNWDRAARGVA